MVFSARKNRKTLTLLRPCDSAVYSDWESNPDQRFRKPTFYPLNYQSPFYVLTCNASMAYARYVELCKDRKKRKIKGLKD